MKQKLCIFVSRLAVYKYDTKIFGSINKNPYLRRYIY
jgi:hypothetical protein